MVLLEIPIWSRKALQGITYWIGHRRCLYSNYPLGESAFIAELCNLIFAHLGKHQTLRCEMMYSELAGGAELPELFGRRARADIVVLNRSEATGGEPVPKFIVEVKRGSAPTKEVDRDLRRLAAIARLNRECRVMLFIISEAKRLDRFVTSDGQSVSGPHKIPDDDGHFRIRRTFKAAHAFKTRDTAQYASLLEVYPTKPPKDRAAIKSSLRKISKKPRGLRRLKKPVKH